MKLICLETGSDITPKRGDTLICKSGAVAGDKFKFSELIAPTDDNPKGFVRSKKTGMSWVDYYPEVFNAKIDLP